MCESENEDEVLHVDVGLLLREKGRILWGFL